MATLLLLLCSMSVSAYDFEADGFYFNILQGAAEPSCEVTSGDNQYSGYIVVPESVTHDGTAYKVTAIGKEAFLSSDVQSVTIPSSVTEIKDNAFRWSGLSRLSLSEGLKIIDSGAFMQSGLRYITIPKSVTYIGVGAFSMCGCLRSITCLGEEPITCSDYLIDDNYEYSNIPIYVPAGCEAAYKNDAEWGKFANISAIFSPVEVSGLYYKLLTDNTCEVTSGENDYSGDIIVPQSITSEGTAYTVIGIADAAFKGCRGLNSVSLPNTIMTIGNGAFQNCYDIQSIILPDALKTIGESAFNDCENMRNITIPASVTSIGVNAFARCNQLTSIICEGTTPPAFAIASGEDEWRDRVFIDATLYVPTGAIDAYKVAEGWSKFKTIHEPAIAVDGISYNLLNESTCEVVAGTEKYTDDIVIPSEITAPGTGMKYQVVGIGDRAFKECCVAHVSIPVTVTYIGNGAFYGCRCLQAIEIPSSVISIGEDAFRECDNSNLGNITIPASVTSIGVNAFASCGSLSSIICEGTIPPAFACASDEVEWRDVVFKNATLYVPAGAVDAYKAAEGWSKFLTILTPPVEVDGLLYNLSIDNTCEVAPNRGNYSDDIVIPESITNEGVTYMVTGIAARAFQNCWRVNSIIIPATLKTIGESAFEGCDNLANITIPVSVTSIGINTFARCNHLISITCKSTTPPAFACASDEVEWRDVVFKNATLYVPTGAIDAYKAAEGWSKFHTILTPPVEVDGLLYNLSTDNTCEVAQNENSYFGDIVVPESITIDGVAYTVTGIATKAFQDCGDLKSVSLPVTVTAIGEYAFANCRRVESITIPENALITEIADGTFQRCRRLTSITIPPSVTSIGNEAFSDCQLESITLPVTLKTIGDEAFAYCRFKTITIPESVASVGVNAFGWCEISTIICEGTTPPAFAVDSYENEYRDVVFKNATLCVPIGKVTVYAEAEGWSKFLTIREPAFVVDGITYFAIDESTCEVGAGTEKYTGDIVIPAEVTHPDTGRKYQVVAIGNGAFADNRELTSIVIPDGITKIGNKAFTLCLALTQITLPASVTAIGDGAFGNCDKVSSVTCKSVTPPICGSEVFNSYRYAEMTLYVPEAGKDAYRADATWGQFGNIMVPPTLHEGIYYNLYDSDMTCEVTAGEQQYTGNVTIPTTITIGEGSDAKVYTVTTIDANAFLGCTDLTDITIPSTVTTIEDNAFKGCTAIKSVTFESTTLPNGVDFEYEVSRNAIMFVPVGCLDTYKSYFTWWRNIMEPVAIDEQGVWYRILSMEDKTCTVVATVERYTYAGDIVIPETVTYKGEEYTVIGVDEYAFLSCKDLTSVVIGKNVTSIGDKAFMHDDKLTSVTIGAKVETLGEDVFAWCEELQTINCLGATPPVCKPCSQEFHFSTYSNATLYVPEDAKASYVADEVWGQFKKVLTSTDEFYSDEWLYRILSAEDKTCELITVASNNSTVEIPASVTYNGIAYKVVKFGEKAFAECANLSSVQLPTTITEIVGNSVSECANLQNIICLGTTPPTCTDGFAQNVYETVTLSVPASAKDTYGKTAPWSNFGNIVSNTKFITEDIMYEIRSDEEGSRTCAVIAGEIKYYGDIVVPETAEYDGKVYTVVAVGDRAFYGCPKLASVKLPETVQEIDNEAFACCAELTSVNLPEGITSLESTFRDCSSLESIKLPNSLTNIGNYLFEDCKALTSVNIPDGVKSIGNSAFIRCTSLAEVNIPASTTSIGASAFSCTAITCVVVPEGITSLDRTFESCTNLSEVKLPESLTEIGFGTFESCINLTNIVIPDNVTTLGSYAFFLSGLKEIVIPKNVIKIGMQAFDRGSLQTVYCLASTPPSCGRDVFNNSEYENATLYVPAGTEADYQNATVWKNFLNIQGIEDFAYTVLSEDLKTCAVSMGEHSVLTEVVIPETVTIDGETYTVVAIADEGFKDRAITSVEIPVTITTIGTDAFTGCTEITAVNCKGATPPTYESGFEKVVYDEAVLTIPSASSNLYETQNPWSLFINRNIVTGIGQVAAGGTLSVAVSGSRIVVNGLSDNECVALYGTTGVKIAETVAVSGAATFDTSVVGKTVIIVKAGNRVAKFMVK